MQMPFGKYEGGDIADLPDAYLLWLVRTCDLYGHLRTAVLYELRIRGFTAKHSESGSHRRRQSSRSLPENVIHVPPAERKLFKELVDAGYRTLAMRHHPDHGGDAAVMRRLISLTGVVRRQLSTIE